MNLSSSCLADSFDIDVFIAIFLAISLFVKDIQ